MYSDLVKNKTFPPLDIPQTIVPMPIDDDYDTGVITRYFIQKANDPNIPVDPQPQENQEPTEGEIETTNE